MLDRTAQLCLERAAAGGRSRGAVAGPAPATLPARMLARMLAGYSARNLSTVVAVITMARPLFLGTLHRQRQGRANIGWDGACVFGLHVMPARALSP